MFFFIILEIASKLSKQTSSEEIIADLVYQQVVEELISNALNVADDVQIMHELRRRGSLVNIRATQEGKKFEGQTASNKVPFHGRGNTWTKPSMNNILYEMGLALVYWGY